MSAPQLTETQRRALEHADAMGGFGIVDPDPMLMGLLALGYASSKWVGSGEGPPLLFYDITDAGRAAHRGES